MVGRRRELVGAFHCTINLLKWKTKTAFGSWAQMLGPPTPTNGWLKFSEPHRRKWSDGSFAYVFPEDVDAAQRLFDAKARCDTKPFHFRLRRKDGSAVWVDVQGTPSTTRRAYSDDQKY